MQPSAHSPAPMFLISCAVLCTKWEGFIIIRQPVKVSLLKSLLTRPLTDTFQTHAHTHILLLGLPPPRLLHLGGGCEARGTDDEPRLALDIRPACKNKHTVYKGGSCPSCVAHGCDGRDSGN